MAKEYSRTRRVADQIQRELAQLIQQEVKDPRIGMVTVTAVEVTREFDHAKVYVTVLGDHAQLEASLHGLNSASGFLRRELAHRLKLRATPQLHFVYDSSLEQGIHLSALISEAVGKSHSESESDTAALELELEQHTDPENDAGMTHSADSSTEKSGD